MDYAVKHLPAIREGIKVSVMEGESLNTELHTCTSFNLPCLYQVLICIHGHKVMQWNKVEATFFSARLIINYGIYRHIYNYLFSG